MVLADVCMKWIQIATVRLMLSDDGGASGSVFYFYDSGAWLCNNERFSGAPTKTVLAPHLSLGPPT